MVEFYVHTHTHKCNRINYKIEKILSRPVKYLKRHGINFVSLAVD